MIGSRDGRRRPNILFMIADDHRGFGDPQVRTPQLDGLAARGVRFLGAHCQGGMTGAICAPSRAQVMTGNELFSATRNNVVRDPGATEIADGVPLLPEVFGAAGYRTHLVGKWHNGEAAAVRGFQTGEKVFFGGMSDHHAVPTRDLDSSRPDPLTPVTTREQHSTDLFAGAAERFLRGHGADDDPFLLYVAFTAPHDPRTAPGDWATMYDADTLRLPESFRPEPEFDGGCGHERDEHLTPLPRGAATVRRHLADYYGMVSHLDDGIGRVLRALEETGRADDTIVVYTADHGLALGAHGLLGKQNMYEHSLRVPLVMAGPGIGPGAETDALTLHADLFPTLAELAGVELPAPVGGRSLLPLVNGTAAAARDHIHAAYIDAQRSVRDRRWKLIRSIPSARTGGGTLRTQLFDLAEDPWETRDLSADPARAADLERLGRELERWQEEAGDPHADAFAAAFASTGAGTGVDTGPARGR